MVDVTVSLKDAISSLNLNTMICINGNQINDSIMKLYFCKYYITHTTKKGTTTM